MTNKRFTLMALTMCLLSLGSGLAIASTPPPPPPPPKVVVADSVLPEPPCLHLSQFQAFLNATVTNPPVATDETTIDGPHFQWSCADGFTMPDVDQSADTLTSSPFKELTAGNNAVSVSCTVTYTSTDIKTGVATPLTFSGSTAVRFFVRVPKLVTATLISNVKYGPPDYNFWGHETKYDIYLYDNQMKPQLYSNGSIRESFMNLQLNPTYAYDLQNGNPPAPGQPAPPRAAPYTTDDNGSINAGWTAPPTQDTGDTTLWYKVAQLFACLETADGYPRNPYITPLNTFTLSVQQGITLRQ